LLLMYPLIPLLLAYKQDGFDWTQLLET